MRSAKWAFFWEYLAHFKYWLIFFLFLLIIFSMFQSTFIKDYKEKIQELQNQVRTVSLSFEEKRYINKDINRLKWEILDPFYFLVFIHTLYCISLGGMHINKLFFPKRYFTLPVTTRFLIFRNLVPRILTVIILSQITFNLFIFLTGIEVSIIALTLFSITAMLLFNSMLWYAQSAPYTGIPLLVIVSGIVVLWFNAIHGSLYFSKPWMMWSRVSMDQAIFMGSCVIVSIFIGLRGVKRLRCGEKQGFPKGIKWLLEKTISPREKLKKLGSPISAQLWYEWKRKGIIPLVAVLIFYLIFLISISFRYYSPSSIVAGFFYFLFLIFISSVLLAKLFGKFHPDRKNYTIRSFQATLPLKTRDLCYFKLKTAMKSLILCWVSIIACIIFTLFIFYVSGDRVIVKGILKDFFEMRFLDSGITGVRFSVLFLLGYPVLYWIVAVLILCFMFFGRVLSLILVILTGTFLALGYFFVVIFHERSFWGIFISEEVPQILGIFAILATAFSFYISKTMNLLSTKDILQNLGIWIVLSVVFTEFFYTRDMVFFHLSIIVSGFFALALAPFALGPLALYWNRHR